MAPATVNETARVEAEVGKAGVRTLVATIEYEDQTFTSDEEYIEIPALEAEYN